jgi:hypothetical protein
LAQLISGVVQEIATVQLITVAAIITLLPIPAMACDRGDSGDPRELS